MKRRAPARGAVRELGLRLVQRGQMISARLRGGARHFESFRDLRDPLTIVHSPKLVSRAEEGPLELQVLRVCRESS